LFGDDFVFDEENNIFYGSNNGDGYMLDEVIVLGSLSMVLSGFKQFSAY